MTIKKRLFWSNIFMIAVPVISTALIGCVCVGVIWLSLIGGTGLGIKDQEEFDHACMAVSEMLEYDIGRDAGFSSVKPLLDRNRMALTIVAGGETLFEYGAKKDGDAALLSAAELLGGQPTLTLEGRSLYVGEEQVEGVDYTIYLFGNYHGRETYSELKVSLVLSAIVIAFTIFLSILLTNRFLTKSVFKRIEEPLDIKQEIWGNETIGIMDCDGQHLPEDMMKLLQFARTHRKALVLGVRIVGKEMPFI